MGKQVVAGRDFDEKIALLMGWRRTEIDRVVGWAHPGEERRIEPFYYWLGPAGENQLAPPAFSTDEAEARKVASKLGVTGSSPLEICLAAIAASNPHKAE